MLRECPDDNDRGRTKKREFTSKWVTLVPECTWCESTFILNCKSTCTPTISKPLSIVVFSRSISAVFDNILVSRSCSLWLFPSALMLINGKLIFALKLLPLFSRCPSLMLADMTPTPKLNKNSLVFILSNAWSSSALSVSASLILEYVRVLKIWIINNENWFFWETNNENWFWNCMKIVCFGSNFSILGSCLAQEIYESPFYYPCLHFNGEMNVCVLAFLQYCVCFKTRTTVAALS